MGVRGIRIRRYSQAQRVRQRLVSDLLLSFFYAVPMRFRPALFVLTTALLAMTNAAAGQNDVLRVNTRLVEVDVVVRGADGPIANLSKQDFTVADNGKAERID